MTDEQTETEKYYVLERADNPVEDGTPINKVLFDSIDYDLKNPVQRFFNDIIPFFTSGTRLSAETTDILGTWKVSTNTGGGQGPTFPDQIWNAFRKQFDDTIYYDGGHSACEIIIESPKSIINPVIRYRQRSMLSGAKIYGYNVDTSVYDELGSITTGGQGVIIQDKIIVTNNNKYNKFKITATGVSSNYQLRLYNVSIDSGYVITGGE